MKRCGRSFGLRPPLRLLLWAAAPLCIACGGARDFAADRASTVIVAYCCGAGALSPAEDVEAKFLVFLPLLSARENGELEGRLARSWEHTSDYREFTYRLRTDVKWHDGVPVTAHDVKFTLDLLSNPDVGYFAPGFLESVTVTNDSTVTIRSDQNASDFAAWTVYYPKHLLEKLDPKKFFQWEFWQKPVGAGPYRFVRYVPETLMEFRVNPQHYAGKPRIERVVLKFAKGAALTELMSGNVDAVTQVDPAEAAGATSDSRFRSYYSMAPGIVRVLYWRNDHPLFKDRRVRRALTLAIDRRALLGVLRLPPTLPIVDGIPTREQLRRREYSDPLPYDSGRARALLEETGWRDTDGDGIRERDGRPFRFTAIARGEPGYQRIAIFVQEQLRRVGVRMEIQMLDGAVVSKRVGGGDFEAAFSRSAYAGQWLPAAFGEKSVLRYRNPRIVDLIERLAHTPDPNARDAIHREIGEIVQADVPLTFLTPQVWTVLAHRRVRGLSSPWHSDPVGGMDELWLENTP